MPTNGYTVCGNAFFMYVCAVHRGFKKLTELFILKVYPGAKMKNEEAQ